MSTIQKLKLVLLWLISIQLQNPINIVELMAPYVGHILLIIYHDKDGWNYI
jgi:hypothetical protein